MTKPATAAGYDPAQTERAERLLLEIWSRLGDYHDYLVLVGGLVPRFIVPQHDDRVPRHCGTLDVDLGVSLAVRDANAYAGIHQTLERMGLRPGTNRRGNEQRHSFVKEDSDARIDVDFLTTEYGGPERRVRKVQSELSAIQAKGLGLALQDPLLCECEGKTLTGGIVKVNLRVCRPVPFVVLKALAFDRRHEGKDANDLVYVLRYCKGTPQGLAGEVRKDELNAASFKDAVDSMKENFASLAHDGPVQYARFNRGGNDERTQAFAAVQEFLRALPK